MYIGQSMIDMNMERPLVDWLIEKFYCVNELVMRELGLRNFMCPVTDGRTTQSLVWWDTVTRRARRGGGPEIPTNTRNHAWSRVDN